MESGTALVTGLGGAIATVLAAWALVVKARGQAARPGQLLRRLWDWIEGESLAEQVPPTLRGEVIEAINGEAEKQ